MKKAVFLDRDGVVIKQVHYLHRAADVELESGVGVGLKKLHDAGFGCFVVTNQSGVARGMFTLADVEEVHAEIRRQLQKFGTDIDGFYICPHHPEYDGDCDCRKPKPGLIFRAAAEHDIDLANSFMAGDKAADVVAGRNAGCRQAYLVLTGYGKKEQDKLPAGTPIAADFPALVEAILSESALR